MRAIGINNYGSLDVLEEFNIKLEELGDTDVVVNTKAVSINPFDTKLRAGNYLNYPNQNRPLILGLDMAGVITEVGPEVTKFKVGDLVSGRPPASSNGTYREQIVINQERLVEIPDNVMLESAAALISVGGAAYHALFTYGELQENQHVLIHGGAGGVGHIAVQLAKLKGAFVTTTASSKHHDYLKSLGADVVVDYNNQAFEEVVSNIDLVVDTVGCDVQQKSLNVLSPTGRVVSLIEKLDSEDERVTYFSAKYTVDSIKELLDLVASGDLLVEMREILPFTLENVKHAHQQLESKHGRGKIVLTF